MIKPVVFFILISASAVVSSLFFLEKFKDEHPPLDEIKEALSWARGMLGASNVIGCLTYTEQPETVYQVINAMVPVSVVPNTSRDTNLLVFKQDAADSLVREKVDGMATLWEHRSVNYYFRLVYHQP